MPSLLISLDNFVTNYEVRSSLKSAILSELLGIFCDAAVLCLSTAALQFKKMEDATNTELKTLKNLLS